MDYSILKTEIELPLYAGMTDSEVVTELNLVDKPLNKSSLSGSEVWNATDTTEYLALATDALRANWLSFCGISSHDPFGVSAQFVIDVFGGGSATVASLALLREDTVSRASVLGLPTIRLGDIEFARTV